MMELKEMMAGRIERKMTRSIAALLTAGLLGMTAAGCGGDATQSDAGAEAEAPAHEIQIVETASHRFEEIAPGVHFAVGTGSIFVQSNAMVVVNDEDVLVVDSHVTAAAGQALIDSIGELTDKPIRYLINTHYHFDHAHGNQVFGDDVTIIGHEFTREKLLGPVLEEATYKLWTGSLGDQVKALESQAQSLDPGEREEFEAQIAVQAAHVVALEEVVPTAPSVTLRKKMTLRRGERAIELHHLGRGHTAGDVVVFLPEEKVVFTGDLLVSGPAYMGDGYVDEWNDTLEALKELDFEWILPGHGEATQDRGIIDVFQYVLGNFWDQTSTAKGEGKSAEEAADGISLAELLSPYPDNAFTALPEELGRAVHLRQVTRAYEVMDEAGD